MRTALAALALALLVPAGTARAGGNHSISADDSPRPPERWVTRYEPEEVSFVIVSAEDDVELLLTRDAVAIQLSHQMMRKFRRESRRERRKDDDGALATGLKALILDSVGTLLNHALDCPLDRVQDVRYRDGKIEIVTFGGRRVFEGVRVNDHPAMAAFSERDARAFVREIQRRKGAS